MTSPSVGRSIGSSIKVVVVDDHPVFRLGMVALLTSIDGLDVVGEAATADEAVDVAASARPDVIVMDLNLGTGSGIDATRRIRDTEPAVGVLAVTMMDDDDSVFAAMRAGARGYLLKGAAPDDIERAVRAVANGEVILGPQVAARAIGFLSSGRTSSAVAFPELTAREREILDLVARGLDNTSVSRRLDLSPKTIRNNLSNVFTKLQVADRSQAIIRARDAGLGQT
jgi:DNA-binding NarL/FixJ family response regulator